MSISASRGFDLAYVGRRFWRFLSAAWLGMTILWFFAFSAKWTFNLILMHGVGSDALLYAKAGSAWIHGQDPWQVSMLVGNSANRLYFLAPPPTLLPFIPFAWLPEEVVVAAWILIDVVAFAYVLRRLKLPWWFIAYPPALEAIVVGNPEPLMLAAMLVGSRTVAAVAPILKVYAAVPLVGERRWRALVIAGAVVVVTAPLLQWDRYIGELGWIRQTLASQLAYADLSAWGFTVAGLPVIVPLAALALIAYGKRAWWLAVPVLWPVSQLHYAMLALPALVTLSPLMAIGFGYPIGGLRGWFVLVGALVLIWPKVAGRLQARSRARVEPEETVTPPATGGFRSRSGAVWAIPTPSLRRHNRR